MDFQLKPESLAHGVQRDGIHVVGRSQPRQLVERFAGRRSEFRDSGRGEVLEFRVVARHAQNRGEARIEPDEGVRVGVGDAVNGGLGARRG